MMLRGGRGMKGLVLLSAHELYASGGLLHAVSRRRISGGDAWEPGQKADLMRKGCRVVVGLAVCLRE